MYVINVKGIFNKLEELYQLCLLGYYSFIEYYFIKN